MAVNNYVQISFGREFRTSRDGMGLNSEVANFVLTRSPQPTSRRKLTVPDFVCIWMQSYLFNRATLMRFQVCVLNKNKLEPWDCCALWQNGKHIYGCAVQRFLIGQLQESDDLIRSCYYIVSIDVTSQVILKAVVFEAERYLFNYARIVSNCLKVFGKLCLRINKLTSKFVKRK